jgi:hypothetical protein
MKGTRLTVDCSILNSLIILEQTVVSSRRSLSPEQAARAQQVRVEIGRLLRQHYEASLPPLSGRLLDALNKLDQSDPVDGGLQTWHTR